MSAWRCSFGLPVLGTIAALQASDQGQQVANQWGADRTKDQPAAPDNAWTEQYTTLVQNSVDRPRVARGGISCRKAHRESTTGGYVPALDAEGRYVRRTGFMVGCNTDLDCYSRCGEHPIHGSSFVCTHHPEFYTHAGESRDAFDRLVRESARAKAAGAPHARAWRPHNEDDNFYLVDEPGDDAMDPSDGSMGVCTDVHAAYANTGCLDPTGAQVTMSLVGCVARWTNWNLLFCGALIEHADSDFVTDVGIAESTLLYPRTLVHEAQVNGVVRPAVTCWNPLDCNTKCEFFRTHSRDGGLGVRARAPQPTPTPPRQPNQLQTTGTRRVRAVQARVPHRRRHVAPRRAQRAAARRAHGHEARDHLPQPRRVRVSSHDDGAHMHKIKPRPC